MPRPAEREERLVVPRRELERATTRAQRARETEAEAIDEDGRRRRGRSAACPARRTGESLRIMRGMRLQQRGRERSLRPSMHCDV